MTTVEIATYLKERDFCTSSLNNEDILALAWHIYHLNMPVLEPYYDSQTSSDRQSTRSTNSNADLIFSKSINFSTSYFLSLPWNFIEYLYHRIFSLINGEKEANHI
jgi:hypothetical protein